MDDCEWCFRLRCALMGGLVGGICGGVFSALVHLATR
jgi:hypothetical protein